MFITFEGGEGAGKTTQALRLVDRLRETGRVARFTREPGGTSRAYSIRALILHPQETFEGQAFKGLVPSDEEPEPDLPMTEALLFSAARSQHVAAIRGWLDAGEIVVCDRFIDATRAYQGAARGVSLGDIIDLERMATGGLRPDLTFLLNVSVVKGLERKRSILKHTAIQMNLFEPLAWNRLDRENVAFHESVRDAYLKLAGEDPTRWEVLSADEASKDELSRRIWQKVQTRLKQSGQ